MSVALYCRGCGAVPYSQWKWCPYCGTANPSEPAASAEKALPIIRHYSDGDLPAASPPAPAAPVCDYPQCDCACSFPDGYKPSVATECPRAAAPTKEVERPIITYSEALRAARTKAVKETVERCVKRASDLAASFRRASEAMKTASPGMAELAKVRAETMEEFARALADKEPST